MKTYRASLLFEGLVALSIISVITVLFANAKPREAKEIKEEAGVIFMGALLGEMRESSESQKVCHLSVKGDVMIHLNNARIEKKRTYLPEGTRMVFSIFDDPTFNVGPNYSFEINLGGRKSGEIIFIREGKSYLRMMINFGSYIIDIR